jgi:2-methylfumaryl-CoA isomerase
MFSRIEQPGIGAYRVPGTPMSFTGEAREAPVRAPVLGEHTEEILGDVAGLPDAEIAALFDAGIVAQAARPGDVARMAS